MRDITLGDTFYHFFTTRQFSDGVPTLLAGSPVLSVIEQDNVTPITAGVSVQVSRASVVGLNQATIIATSGNGYETGKSYAIYISTGTVGGDSVVGEVVGEFTIEKGSAFIRLGAPAGASVSADIADVPTVAELNARTLLTASYFDPATDTVVNVTNVATLSGHTPQTADHTAAIADIPTVAEFNARTILSASYFDPATDTVVTVTNLTNLPSIPANWLTAAGINAAALTAAKFAAGAIDAAALNADAVDKIRDGLLPTQNATFSDIPFLFVDSVDDVTPVTGATGITITRSLDGAAFGAVSGTTVTEIGNGMYHIDASATDMNAGKIVFRIAATGGTPNAPHDAFVTIITGGGV